MAEGIGDTPWLTIVGLGEDGPTGLAPASRDALAAADVVIGAPRHLALIGATAAEQVEWPVPFSDGLPIVCRYRGQRVVVLASGDPFWFGAGAVLARHLAPGEWRAYPALSAFSLAASRLGWPLERTPCLGLHAAPLARLRPLLVPGTRALVLLRDGAAVTELAAWLDGAGFGDSVLHVMEALGGARERVRRTTASTHALADVGHPVALGVEIAGSGATMPTTSGLPDAFFDHDGQITKRPVRALTLSALAPRAGEHLWDIGAGSGSIGIEWLLSHPTTQAIAFEADPTRAARARANAAALGVDRLRVVEGRAPGALDGAALPQAVFVGGGLSEALLERLFAILAPGTRLVANAVTLESEALLTRWHSLRRGDLMRIDLSEAAPIGSRRGWRAAYPVVQWSVRT